MADMEKNITPEQEEEQEVLILTLEDEDGEVYEFARREEAIIDGKRYFALTPVDGKFDDYEEEGSYVILRVFGEGEDMTFENLDPEEEDRVAEYFDDLFWNEIDYDEE